MRIRVFTAFSGYDSQLLALERLKRDFPSFDYECVGWCEIDKYAIQAHNALFPDLADKNYGDICKIDWEKVPDFDLFTMSSPCFPEGTMVLTSEGYRDIKDLRKGDYVLTHSNQYKRVEEYFVRQHIGDIYHIRSMSSLDTECTPNHPFYVRRMSRVWDNYRRSYKRFFANPEWTEARDLDKSCYLGYAINTQCQLPQWDGVINHMWGHNKPENKLAPLFTNPYFWYLMGRYVGDGWRRESNNGRTVVICCSDRNKDSLLNAMDNVGWHYRIVKERTVYKVIVCSNELYFFMARYGYRATGKRVDAETMALPNDLLKGFIDGLMQSDGCISKGWHQICTTSKELVYGIAQCVAKVYHRPISLYHTKRKPTVIIEGRLCNQHDTYMARWHKDARKQEHAFFEDGYVWYPISKIWSEKKTEVVFNLEVEQDHSYTANGAIVHNCQDFSIAGQMQGGAEGSGTRSSLLWECRKAIIARKPKYILFENVKNLVSDTFRPGFMKWQNELASYGYSNFAQVLNAKDYGVPQNRERIFMVSILDFGGLYHFPKKIPLTLRLRDVLEDEPNNKYYLSDRMVDSFMEHRKRHEARGNGFAFKPTDGAGVAHALTSKEGNRHCDNFIDEKYYLSDKMIDTFLKKNEIPNNHMQFKPMDRDGVAKAAMARHPIGATDSYIEDEQDN